MTVLSHKRPILFAALALLQLVVVANDSLADLKRNPFERPPAESLVTKNAESPGQEESPWSPELRAVLLAGRNSVVNLGGAVLTIGESAHGYRLHSVAADTATFIRRGERVVISLHAQEAKEKR